ncbi:threonine-phosphate decarboxylase CobD [Clostridiaceae bacterium 35-E11]
MRTVKHGGNIYEIANQLGIEKEELIDFSANINPLGVPDSFKKALIKHIDLIKNYPDPEYKALTKAIADHHGIEEAYITVGNGATEVIFSIVSALRPKHSLILAPTFLEYERALRKVGSNVNYCLLKEENNFQIDDQFLDSIEKDIDLIILCNPNNPTSQLIDRKRMYKILQYCEEKNIHLLIDEAFMDFVEDFDQATMLPYVAHYKHLYIIKALTKFFALPGLRIGYGLTSNIALLEKVKNLKEPWTVNSYAALAGEIVLQDDVYIHQSRIWIESERGRFYDALKEIDKIKVYPPKANYILFQLLTPSIHIKDSLLQKKFLIRSCDNYPNLNNHFYRIAIKSKEANEKFIKALNEVFYED